MSGHKVPTYNFTGKNWIFLYEYLKLFSKSTAGIITTDIHCYILGL